MTVQSLCRVKADILTAMLGSNDLLQLSHPSAGECANRMERFLTALLHANGWGVGLAYDSVHFSEVGHLAFAKGIHQTLSALLSKDCSDGGLG